MARRAAAAALPDGISEASVRRGARRSASPLSLVVLGAIVAWGASGFAGGRDHHLVADAPAARLTVHWPQVIRNGEIYEAEVEVLAKRPIGKVVLALGTGLLRATTVNSMVPEAKEQSHEKDAFRFEFGKLAAGEALRIKIDAQINPILYSRNAGRVTLYDGDAELAGTDLEMHVLP